MDEFSFKEGDVRFRKVVSHSIEEGREGEREELNKEGHHKTAEETRNRSKNKRRK